MPGIFQDFIIFYPSQYLSIVTQSFWCFNNALCTFVFSRPRASTLCQFPLVLHIKGDRNQTLGKSFRIPKCYVHIPLLSFIPKGVARTWEFSCDHAMLSAGGGETMASKYSELFYALKCTYSWLCTDLECCNFLTVLWGSYRGPSF